jgi:cellulose synthase/poly-beta-1,6-N-acetylglucosamine synthase-like glycosyltransferase
MRPPLFSIIVPAHQAEHLLPKSLGAILATDLPRENWELIVVDDASRDDTAIVAARYADTVVRLPGKPHGPAYARNRGVEVSSGSIVAFFDADVCAHPDTLRRFAEVFTANPGIGAVFGSYDTHPTEKGLVSQYRNLLHHFVHQRNAGEVETFWAGCGAVRRDVFLESGMYDEWHFARPQIEDIELGHRIRSLGKKILLAPDIQATHLKRWTFRGVVRTDLHDRGIPWARLLAHRGTMLTTGTLNLKIQEKINTVLIWLALIGFGVAAVIRSRPLALWSLAALLPIILFNLPLYRFFTRERGLLFAIAITPLQLMYYCLNGISVGLGVLLHETFGAPMPDPTVDAFAEVGLQRWPPVPSKRNPSTWNSPT